MQIEQCRVFPRRNEVADTISVVHRIETILEEEIITLVDEVGIMMKDLEVEGVMRDGEVTIEEQTPILDTEVAVVAPIIIVREVEEVDITIKDIRAINSGGTPTKK